MSTLITSWVGLEDDPRISRLDLPLWLRSLGLTPVRRGLPTPLRRVQTDPLANQLSGTNSLEAIPTVLLPAEPSDSASAVPVGPARAGSERAPCR